MAVDLAADGVGNVVAQPLVGLFPPAEQSAEEAFYQSGFGRLRRFGLCLRLLCGFFRAGGLLRLRLFRRKLLQGFVGGEIVHRVFIVAVEDVVLEQAAALFGRQRGKL